MRAIVVKEFGPPESLTVEDWPEPEPGPGQVRVRVEAAGVNYVDAIMASGGYQITPQLPYVPGSEVAGAVDAVGDGVESPAVGDRVLTSCGFGGFAEAVVVKAEQALPIPDGIDIKVDKNTHIVVSGADKQLVGQVAADIRGLRSPDPYKQKGIRYTGEQLKKKAGKTGAT